MQSPFEPYAQIGHVDGLEEPIRLRDSVTPSAERSLRFAHFRPQFSRLESVILEDGIHRIMPRLDYYVDRPDRIALITPATAEWAGVPVAISYCSGLAQGWVEELRRIELLTCVVYNGDYQPEWLPLRYIHYSAVAEMARRDGPTGHLMFTKFCGRMPEDRHLAPGGPSQTTKLSYHSSHCTFSRACRR